MILLTDTMTVRIIAMRSEGHDLAKGYRDYLDMSMLFGGGTGHAAQDLNSAKRRL